MKHLMLWASCTPSSRGACLGSLTCPMGTSSRFCSFALGALLLGAADPAKPGSSTQAPADRDSAVRLFGAGSAAAAKACGGASAASEPAPLPKHQQVLISLKRMLNQKPATWYSSCRSAAKLKVMSHQFKVRKSRIEQRFPCIPASAQHCHTMQVSQVATNSKQQP